jgi:predicted nucleic acid-binding protein
LPAWDLAWTDRVAALDRAIQGRGHRALSAADLSAAIWGPAWLTLLARFPEAQDALFGLLKNGALKIAYRIEEHVPALRKVQKKYRDAPMSLADACVVRMTEIHEREGSGVELGCRYWYISI